MLLLLLIRCYLLLIVIIVIDFLRIVTVFGVSISAIISVASIIDDNNNY